MENNSRLHSERAMIRFKLRLDKIIEGIQLLAEHQPGITQYYIGKVFFFADREHLLDWGRPISGDRYVAMEHGPVPSAIYDLIKDTSGEPDDIVDELNARVVIHVEGNKRKVFSKEGQSFKSLSQTDQQYLLESLRRFGHMSFGDIRKLSHEDLAWEKAWDKPGLSNEMDPSLWFSTEPGAALEQLLESPALARRPVAPVHY